ncbi:MAG: ComF family protein [Lutibacter sp.]|uniref:ComF family protein n=1 Tax=Lutibacter sp. TaxID=1925666 RepID=UPI00184A78BD|nr:phosphoribosyltransferase family protein [Lutibacter sp.]MBT8318350.1 ComF family protein [Lutibacter sp.]NNJ59208.1 ComF family protein [Lutibacter sp.]
MKFLKDIFNIFFPEICLSCKVQLAENEGPICIKCRHDLPLTNFTFEPANLVEKTFYGRIPIEKATALFYFFKKGKVQQLMHELKYNKQQQVGTFVGNWLGSEMIESKRFENIDYIIPVPLHKNKLKTRGYNQVTTFGESLSQKLMIPFNDTYLIKISSTRTQTKKLRLDRWKNVQELFVVQHQNNLIDKHILLIDDIITTGATLEACCKAFGKIEGLKISIACMAYTK